VSLEPDRKGGKEASWREISCYTFVIFMFLCLLKTFHRISLKGVSRAEYEAKELCARYTTDVVATCAYGIRGNALQDPNCEFRRMGRAILEPSFWKNIKMIIIILLPRLAKFLRLG
jgi:cytochrome P450 family 6